MEKVRKWGLILIILFVVIQLIPVERSNPEVKNPLVAPPEIMSIFRRSCFDCHSNETRWPWYSKIAPISWFISAHVQKGRKELNFSEWGSYSRKKQRHKLEQIPEEIFPDQMPPRSYLLMHPEARLNATEKGNIDNWVNFVLDQETSARKQEEHPSAK